MHVVLVSACEKRALKRTRAILDSYALRSGDSTWITAITIEGLDELRGLLRARATRQTSVACFRNDGRKRMRLLWVVGRRDRFNRVGASPVATQIRRKSPEVPPWIGACAAIASAAGFAHDLGKYGQAFQEKLRMLEPIPDPVRHEWISLLLLREMLTGKTLEEAWVFAENNAAWVDSAKDPFGASLGSASAVLLFLVATHHRLPAEGTNRNVIGISNHVKDNHHRPRPVAHPTRDFQSKLDKRLRRVCVIGRDNPDPVYWRAIALLSRMALILADHSVSAEKLCHPNAAAYANTTTEVNGGALVRRLNQSLEWHLENVGQAAGDMAFRLASFAPPALAEDTIERICAPAEGRFVWQNVAAQALSASSERHRLPHLVFNMAGTGSGKTRMNVRAACVLATAGASHGVRVATALNLRTLTLQTADAYTEQLGIGKDELACVIGDRLTYALHQEQKAHDKSRVDEARTDLDVDEDGNPSESEFEAAGEFEYGEAPQWLQGFIGKKPHLKKIIGAPVLVSTIDFLVAAGEPQRQGNHALAALRLMTSDLILDEIDSYDPKPLMAVLRLVMITAMFGRNVIASSATLSYPVAEMVWRAFTFGIEMRARLHGESRPLDSSTQLSAFAPPSLGFATAFVDDLAAPVVATYSDEKSFTAAYKEHVRTMSCGLDEQRLRVPELRKLTKDAGLQGWLDAVTEAALLMHGRHAWIDPETCKQLSFGLVRVANIRTAVRVAQHLASKLDGARVACYHSQHFVMQRFHIEQRLDRLLTRKNGNKAIFVDTDIRARLKGHVDDDLMFVVVATPVEEIGRDHDFDWAVIEPSSVQSIVQTAGRVNRHRLQAVSEPNVALLQFNRRAVCGERTAFVRPGLEPAENSAYAPHDLAELLHWNGLGQIDARMRFDYRHRFAELDDQSIRNATDFNLKRLLSNDLNGNLWMSLETYTKTPLREHVGDRIELAWKDADRFDLRIEGSDHKSERRLSSSTREHNDWLVLEDDDLVMLAQEFGVDPVSAMTVSVPVWGRFGPDTLGQIKRHRSFGFYMEGAPGVNS